MLKLLSHLVRNPDGLWLCSIWSTCQLLDINVVFVRSTARLLTQVSCWARGTPVRLDWNASQIHEITHDEARLIRLASCIGDDTLTLPLTLWIPQHPSRLPSSPISPDLEPDCAYLTTSSVSLHE
jgi:hypothetical protein